MKKIVTTLCINDYEPEITELTFPYMENYAKKINAEFHIIKDRKYPQYPINYEKFQLYDISKDYDWTIFFDADTIIHPDAWDFTDLVSKDFILMNAVDFCKSRFRTNKTFLKDGRNVGACTWFVACSDWTRETWLPFDQNNITYDQAIKEITPVLLEKNFGYSVDHIIDDYLVSYNIARFGLKIKTIENDINRMSGLNGLLQHTFAVDNDYKRKFIKKYIEIWNSRNLRDDNFIQGIE